MIVNSFRDEGLWPVARASLLAEQFRALASKEVVRWTWAPTPATIALNYFAHGLDDVLENRPEWHYVPCDDQIDWSSIDILILTGHGSDMSTRIMEYKLRNPRMLVAVWLWDNHLAHINNLRTVMASDIYFPSHHYDSAYLQNFASPSGMHVPLCCAQWTESEARGLLSELKGLERSDRLLLNYVDYKFSWRSELLAKLRAELPQAQALLMPATDRGRYFQKSSKERLAEWLSHKCTLILPVQQDLSTRIYDALLAGQVIIVPTMVADFDAVFPADVQAALGVVRVDDLELHTISKAVDKAVATFDAMGEAGVQVRSDYVLNGGMMGHRLLSMLNAIRTAGQGTVTIRMTEGEGMPLALRFVRA